tara:strand:+ start:3294 stop:4124 length:831 start_codon:yes stop_codon:yes gene_type:complete
MIVDFSLRPPYKSLTKLEQYQKKPEENFAPKIGMTVSAAAAQFSMDLLMKEMDDAGIVHGVCHGRPSVGTKNEDLIGVMQEYPGKFTAFAGVRFTDLGQAVAETKHCLDGLGLIGIAVEPSMGIPPLYPDDAKLYPIYELCRERGSPILFTLSAQVGSDISYSNPVHLDRVAADFPTVNLIVRHACWPWVTEACGVALRRPNVYLVPDAYGVSMPGYQQWVEAANTYLADRLLFGTAFPIVPLKPMVEAFRKLPFRDDVREKVEYSNAARLLNLPG